MLDWHQIMTQYPQLLYLALTLPLFGGVGEAMAQNAENGRRLAEQWCSGCHAIDPAAAKPGKTISFASIAAKQTVTTEMITSFLPLPHATMPNMPLSRSDIQDIAAYIMGMKK
jgi:mono/diheme cytochrome c family protein